MALLSIHFSNESTFKLDLSNFYINRTINNKVTVGKVVQFLHLCNKRKKMNLNEKNSVQT